MCMLEDLQEVGKLGSSVAGQDWLPMFLRERGTYSLDIFGMVPVMQAIRAAGANGSLSYVECGLALGAVNVGVCFGDVEGGSYAFCEGLSGVGWIIFFWGPGI
jgi:hypothetical protein